MVRSHGTEAAEGNRYGGELDRLLALQTRQGLLYGGSRVVNGVLNAAMLTSVCAAALGYAAPYYTTLCRTILYRSIPPRWCGAAHEGRPTARNGCRSPRHEAWGMRRGVRCLGRTALGPSQCSRAEGPIAEGPIAEEPIALSGSVALRRDVWV